MSGEARLSVDGHVATITIDNPPVNVITADVRHCLLGVLGQVRDHGGIRAVVVTGAGDRAFCAGADLREEEQLTPATVRQFLAEDNAVYDQLEELDCPVVAAVHGYCMGGGFELALASDIRVVSADTKLCAAGVKVGLVVSTSRLVRLTGLAAAKDIVLTGRTFTGDEAGRLGVATRVVPAGEERAEAQRIAAEIASRAPLAVARAKSALHEAADLAFADAYTRELDHFAALSDTDDHKQAIAAFFRKETPRFAGQ
ncbi:MAG: enoyl-CoA hydratase/isomerase family protein [Streptosporangiales bacterium]|nr:enoyl-CoA hydratase/isomerase family protein [Streptosporangiales bacterium]